MKVPREIQRRIEKLAGKKKAAYAVAFIEKVKEQGAERFGEYLATIAIEGNQQIRIYKQTEAEAEAEIARATKHVQNVVILDASEMFS